MQYYDAVFFSNVQHRPGPKYAPSMVASWAHYGSLGMSVCRGVELAKFAKFAGAVCISGQQQRHVNCSDDSFQPPGVTPGVLLEASC